MATTTREAPGPVSGADSPPEPGPWLQARDRLLEISPGLLTWTLVLAPAWIPIAFGYYGALSVAIAILIFDLYWFTRATIVVTGSWGTYRHLRRDMEMDWLEKCREPVPEGARDPLSYYHLCLIPTYTEPYGTLERTVQAMAEANYPKELKLVGIITRETDKPGWANVARLREKFGDQFQDFHHIKDPLEPPLVPGKSAAMNWGGREMVKRLTDLGYDLKRVIVTDLDSDYRVHPQYFPWLSYHQARTPLPDSTIWQPIQLFYNNIWAVPTAVRVMTAISTQSALYNHSQPRRLVPFSSYSLLLDTVRRVGYWDKDVIPEDSRFFWKSFFVFGRDLKVRPCFLPLYGDSPESRDYAGTLLNQYNQTKRWAWGVTDIPYAAKRLFEHPEIPFWLRVYRFWNLSATHVNWVFLPILLLLGTDMPVWVSVDFSLTDFGQNLWVFSTLIVSAALFSAAILIYVEARLLPPKPPGWNRLHRVAIYFQYLTFPIVGIVLNAIPALESHTRLLLGKYLEYRVTEKV